MAANARQLVLVGIRDILRPDADAAAVGLGQADHEFQTRTLAGSAAAHEAKRLTLTNLEGYVVENLSTSKRLGYVPELHRDRAVNVAFLRNRNDQTAHMAFLGKRKKIAFTRMTSTRIIRREDRTTLLVAACCTPSDPSSVV